MVSDADDVLAALLSTHTQESTRCGPILHLLWTDRHMITILCLQITQRLLKESRSHEEFSIAMRSKHQGLRTPSKKQLLAFRKGHEMSLSGRGIEEVHQLILHLGPGFRRWSVHQDNFRSNHTCWTGTRHQNRHKIISTSSYFWSTRFEKRGGGGVAGNSQETFLWMSLHVQRRVQRD